MLEIEFLRRSIEGRSDGAVDEIGNQGCNDHQDTHGKDPDDEGSGHLRICRECESQEGDEGDSGNAVGFEPICSGADAVPCIVTSTIGNDTGILGVIFREVEDNLHEIRSNIGDLGEYAAADPEGARAQRLADGKSDETGTDQFLRDEHEDADHEEELHAHKQEPHAHTGLEGNADDVGRLSCQRCKGSP